MRSAPILVSIALAAGLALGATAQAADVYKWTDDKGVVHYADAPPDGQKYERMRVSSGTTTAAPDPAPQATPAAATPEPGSVEDQIAKHKAARAQNCQIARDNLALIENSPDVQKDFDGDGKPEPMTPEQRASEIKANQDAIVRSCE